MANRRFIDFPVATTVGANDIILIWQDGLNKQTTKATFLSGLPENLDELNDVAISGLTNGQILRYDSVTGKWENTDQGNLDLNDLNDVSIVSPSNGQVLVYNSSTSQWENSSGGYVPYVGAVTTVDLGAQQLKAGYTTLTTNGSTETLTINHTSGSGKAINVTKGGAGEGLYVNKTSGSGNAATIVGTLEATTLNKTAGTSTQFLKADGSVDSTTYQNTADKGQPNGYASLDGNGKVPLTQINDALIGNVNFQGLWNASTNTPTLVDPPSSGTKGYYYIVSTGGTFAGITFEVGDWIISNGTAWGKVDNTDAVSSVFGRTGNVTAINGDYNTSQVTESGNLYYTDARSRAALSFAAGSGAYNSGTGVITIPTNNNQITNGAGYITSAALSGYVQGSGTTNYLPKFTGSTTIGNSNISDDGSGIIVTGGTSMSGGWNRNTILEATYPVLVYNSNGSKWAGIGYDYSAGLRIWVNASSSDVNLGANNVLFLDNSGAATFSSSVTANGNFSCVGASSSTAPQLNFNQIGGNTYSVIGINRADGTGIASGLGSALVIRSGDATDFPIQFATANNVRATISTSGNVGIGTTSYTVSSGYTGLGINNATNGGVLDLLLNDVKKGEFYITSSSFNMYGFSGVGINLTVNNDLSKNLSIATTGNVLIGTTSDNGAKLQVSGGAATFSSSVTATSFFESSDSSLKTLVEDNYQAKGIDSVVAKLYIKNGKEELGYYAQDLQEVLPSAVSKGSDGLLNLSYREVHTAKIAYLEEKIKQLENELGRISK
jgi:hypothetical protein